MSSEEKTSFIKTEINERIGTLKPFSLAKSRDCKTHITAKYPRIFPNFQNYACCEKELKDNKLNSLHLARKYALIFVP